MFLFLVYQLVSNYIWFIVLVVRFHHSSVRMASQESYTPVEDMTHEELKLSLSLKDKLIRQQGEEIEMLKSRLQDMMARNLGAPLSVADETLTSTVTTPVWSRPIVTPHVGFTTDLLDMSTDVKEPKSRFPPGMRMGTATEYDNKYSNVVKGTPEYIKLDDSSESVLSWSSSSSSSSERKVHRGDRSSELRTVAKLLDKRECPRPENYSLESGRSFSRFMTSFEAYCESRYSRSHINLWTSELGRFLLGEIKEVYSAHGGPDQKYCKMKRHLESWYAEAKDRVSSSRRAKYRNARISDGEGLKIFATRLEYLFRMAYPRRQLDGKDLKRHLLSAIPAEAGETLERDLAILKTSTGRQNTWGEVLKLLEIQDESCRRSSGRRPVPLTLDPQPWSGAVRKHLAMKVQPSGTQQKSKSKSPKPRSKSPLFCNWCKRRGHIYDTCRRRLNQCLRCGAEDHRIAQCPKPGRRSSKNDRHGKRSSNSSSEAEQSRGRSRIRRRKQQTSLTSGKKAGAVSGFSSDKRPLNRQTPV